MKKESKKSDDVVDPVVSRRRSSADTALHERSGSLQWHQGLHARCVRTNSGHVSRHEREARSRTTSEMREMVMTAPAAWSACLSSATLARAAHERSAQLAALVCAYVPPA